MRRHLRQAALLHRPAYGILNHQDMENLKKELYQDGVNWKLKLKFILKETKYTIVQGSKDLWSDASWLFNLYRRKQRQYFTGYEIG